MAKRLVKAPPQPRAELLQQQALEEERRRAAAAAKLAEIEHRIAQRKAEEDAIAMEVAAVQGAEPEQCLPSDGAKQLATSSSHATAMPVEAAVEEQPAVVRAESLPSVLNAWTKPLSVANSSESKPAIAEPPAWSLPVAELEGASVATEPLTAESPAQMLIGGGSPDWQAVPDTAVIPASDDSLVPAEVNDGRGQKGQRGRGRSRGERAQDGDASAAAERCPQSASSMQRVLKHFCSLSIFLLCTKMAVGSRWK